MVYYPQIKTTTAELLAFKNLNSFLSDEAIIPIFQLTKPRLTKADTSVALNRHIEKIFEHLNNKKMILSITEDETYQDVNLSRCIHDSSNGYLYWRDFVNKIHSNHNKHIIPNILGKASRDNLPEIKTQIREFFKNYEKISIRLPMANNVDYGKISELLGILELNPTEKLVILFDYHYVKTWTAINSSINKLSEYLNIHDFKSTNIPIFSSCPPSFPIGEDREDYKIEKIDMPEYEVVMKIRNLDNLCYGDYAYIHPQRAEEGGLIWFPRIDFPSYNNYCYYLRCFNKKTDRVDGRLKIEITKSNEVAYRELCNEICKQHFFIEDNIESWGKETIKSNNNSDDISGKSPMHYIAIRSNIHMEKVMSLLKS